MTQPKVPGQNGVQERKDANGAAQMGYMCYRVIHGSCDTLPHL